MLVDYVLEVVGEVELVAWDPDVDVEDVNAGRFGLWDCAADLKGYFEGMEDASAERRRGAFCLVF